MLMLYTRLPSGDDPVRALRAAQPDGLTRVRRNSAAARFWATFEVIGTCGGR
jgi:hypothetical protein